MPHQQADGVFASDGVSGPGTASHDELLSRVGHMTRAIHESLRGLGIDKFIERAARDIPDARDRLDYVGRMSEQAAQRVLNATDAAGSLQDVIGADTKRLSASCCSMLAGDAGEEAA